MVIFRSGRYQERFGFEFNCNGATARARMETVGLDPSAPTIADVLRRAGYATAAVGKWHVGFAERHHPLERGFDEFFGFLPGEHSYLPRPGRPASNDELELDTAAGAMGEIYRGRTSVDEKEYLTDAFAREAVAFIERQKQGAKPFFLYLAFNAVHTPFQATDKYMQRFPHVTDPKRRTYYAMTSALDDAVGRVLAALRQSGKEKDTLVIFLSDNGGPIYTQVQSNAPLRLGKLYLFEGGVRVPLIVKWPAALRGGGQFHGIASALDVLPSAAAAAGLTLPAAAGFDGVNLLPFLQGKQAGAPHEWLFWRNGPNRAARHGSWKLVQAGEHVWLFDLGKDISETTNVAAQHPEIVKEIKTALDLWERGLKPPAWPSRPGRPTEIDGVTYEIHI